MKMDDVEWRQQYQFISRYVLAYLKAMPSCIMSPRSANVAAFNLTFHHSFLLDSYRIEINQNSRLRLFLQFRA